MMYDWSHVVLFFFFKQKTAYELRISYWSADVCSSDLPLVRHQSRISVPTVSRSRTYLQGSLHLIVKQGSSESSARTTAHSVIATVCSSSSQGVWIGRS